MLRNKIRKEDGETITPQYLNDIEHDRRSPSSDHIVKRFASVLNIPADILYWLAGRFPGDTVNRNVPPEQIEKAVAVFRKTIKGK